MVGILAGARNHERAKAAAAKASAVKQVKGKATR
jgi:hypothetical protein